ncbi:ATP-binding protein [Curvivirga aplysinae]|uniref:ATP-binding protein n=1 Tax=Curvivirga aplysinae TaxID=2529852 RepID=UPI0012BB556E|nr:ATP-binding protein [Curvivirga aplysinae]MTI10985.1 HAMP domain-containing protein [Curvivirga aplysinae]
MRKFIPKSLSGQMIILTLIAIVSAQLIGISIFADERRDALRAASNQQVLVHTASVVKLLSFAPKSQRDNIIKASTTDEFQLSLSKRPKIKRRFKKDWEADMRFILAMMVDDYADEIHLRTKRDRREWLQWRHDNHDMHENRREWFKKWGDDHHMRYEDEDELEEEMEEHLPAPPTLDRLRENLNISVKLKDGTWLNVKSYSVPGSPLWALPSFIATFISAAAIILIVILMMRRVTKPVKALTNAAEKFGRGEHVDPLASIGPSDIRAASQAFNQMQERLDRFVRDRTRMLAAISHDLRTPITALRIQAEFIGDEELREKILSILIEMQRMTEATLSFAKQDALKEESEETNLHALLESISHDYQDMGKEVTFEGEENIIQNCRPTSLKRALRNLVDNALKYGEAANITLETSKSETFIKISDQGPGIPENLLEQIFEPFVRLDEARNTESGSVGLGLAIARSIVNAHGGKILAENIDPNGLRITIRLPR